MIVRAIETVENWREKLDQDDTTGLGKLIKLRRALLNGLAFVVYTWAGIIVVLSILNESKDQRRDEKKAKGSELLEYYSRLIYKLFC
jgi:hypothetical protein